MTVTDKFMDDSARAAIRALRGLEQTAIMLETYAPEVFPDVNEQGQKHFGRVMMEAAAQAIRDSWALAIKEAENSKRANQVAETARLREALVAQVDVNKRLMRAAGLDDQAIADSTAQARRALGHCPICKQQIEDDHICAIECCPMGEGF